MPDLDFRILGVEAANYGIAPLLHFKLEVTNQPANEMIQSVMLQAQIQIHPTLRSYQPEEKEKLGELFGTPDRWGQTLRARLWTHANANVPQFPGRTEAILSVPCTFDLNVSATKYFYALEDGEVPLLFLFSGTIFYQKGRMTGCKFSRFPGTKSAPIGCRSAIWREMMDRALSKHARGSRSSAVCSIGFTHSGGGRDWRLGSRRSSACCLRLTKSESRRPTNPGETDDAPAMQS